MKRVRLLYCVCFWRVTRHTCIDKKIIYCCISCGFTVVLLLHNHCGLTGGLVSSPSIASLSLLRVLWDYP
ncbi:hypothetical protein L6452_28194 [Arctium lappa]|uniref:Uncharacterized protein n=1 Tax=Arctium lappa TaxID=4217 RepID=A0ACB8ZXK5_ARCLA|nr:hypothetical protein L6452_28194 [Arctium lappa]